jgi:hypothetical protein
MYDSTSVYDGALYAERDANVHASVPLGAEGRTAWVKAIYSGQDSFRWFRAIGIVPETTVAALR